MSIANAGVRPGPPAAETWHQSEHLAIEATGGDLCRCYSTLHDRALDDHTPNSVDSVSNFIL